MKKLFIFGLAVAMLSACGNDPVTNAGYFDDDLDRSVDNSYHDDHSDRSTTVDDHSDRSTVIDDHSVVNHYYPDTIYKRDTVIKTIVDTVVQSIHDTLNDTIFHVDTIIHIDTIVRKTTIRDTIIDTVLKKVSIRDTIPVIQVDTVVLADSTRFTNLKALFEDLPTYQQTANLNNDWQISMSTSRTKTTTDTYTRNTYITLQRRAGSAEFLGRVQIHYLGIPQEFTTNFDYTCLVSLYNSANQCHVESSYSTNYNDGNYVTKSPRRYNNCVIVTELRRCSTETCLSKYSTTYAPPSDYTETIWTGKVKLCNSYVQG